MLSQNAQAPTLAASRTLFQADVLAKGIHLSPPALLLPEAVPDSAGKGPPPAITVN